MGGILYRSNVVYLNSYRKYGNLYDMILTDLNLELYAAKYYNNPNCVDMEEFYEDFNRLKYVKRLIKKHAEGGELKERLILNHIVVLYNVFENEACTRMIYFKMKKYLSYVAPFLILIRRMPKTILDENNKLYYTSNIKLDEHVIEKLRNI